jgi:hypothetical protein
MESRLLLTDELLPLVNDMMDILDDNVKTAKDYGFSDGFVQGYRNAIHDARRNFEMIVEQLAFDEVAEESEDVE